MTKETAPQYLPLVQALAEGKTIQKRKFDKWEDDLFPDWTEAAEDYRIKPEPREYWVRRGEPDKLVHLFDTRPAEVADFEIIHLREVLPC